MIADEELERIQKRMPPGYLVRCPGCSRTSGREMACPGTIMPIGLPCRLTRAHKHYYCVDMRCLKTWVKT